MILMVDDERRRIDNYLLELNMSGLQVEYASSVDDALKILDEKKSDIELLILDVMMPWGEAFNEDTTEGGLRTGLRFYERVRGSRPTLPIMIFTNVVDDGLQRKFEQDKNCRFYQKEDLLPFELAETVKEILQPKE